MKGFSANKSTYNIYGAKYRQGGIVAFRVFTHNKYSAIDKKYSITSSPLSIIPKY